MFLPKTVVSLHSGGGILGGCKAGVHALFERRLQELGLLGDRRHQMGVEAV